MQIHVSTPAVIRGQMKNRVYAVHCRPRYARLAQVRVQKIHPPAAKVSANIVEVTAREIVHDPHSRATR
jgi:hypothetical protein